MRDRVEFATTREVHRDEFTRDTRGPRETPCVSFVTERELSS